MVDYSFSWKCLFMSPIWYICYGRGVAGAKTLTLAKLKKTDVDTGLNRDFCFSRGVRCVRGQG